MESLPVDTLNDKSVLEQRLMSTGNMFTYSNNRCDCLVDTRHNDDGTEFYELKVRSNNDRIDFAYNREGLICCNKNALVELLSLKDDDVEEVKKYFESYGFLFWITPETYTTFKYDDIIFVIRRIKYTIRILSMLCSEKYDYSQLLFLVSYLLFNSIQIDSYYNSPVTYLKNLVENPLLVSEIPYDKGDPDTVVMEVVKNVIAVNNDGKYTLQEVECEVSHPAFLVPDKFVKSQKTELYHEEYEKCLTKLESVSYHNAMIYLFRNFNKEGSVWREFIEFYFHVQRDVAPITKFDVEKMELFDDMSVKIAAFFENKLFREALEHIAHITIKFELDEMLKGITPKYDIQNRAPSWKINNLVTALYFSIFYHNFDASIYKPCHRDNCWRFFEVSATNSKRKYCCPECQNADAQKRHQRKKKNKSM